MGKKKNRLRSKSEFRKLHNREVHGHPTYVYSSFGDEFNYIGITSAPITKRKRNVPLEKNPEPGNKKSSYLRPKTDKDKCKNFGKPLPDWKFTDKDQKKANSIIEENKKKKSQKKKGR